LRVKLDNFSFLFPKIPLKLLKKMKNIKIGGPFHISPLILLLFLLLFSNGYSYVVFNNFKDILGMKIKSVQFDTR
jgi:hypothetical protein